MSREDEVRFSLELPHGSFGAGMTEMRKDRRAPASLKVKYKSATVDEFIEQFGTDVSRGGIFIKTKKPLEAGALLKFEFQLQDGSAVLHGVGRVAWRRLEHQSRPDLPAGMGIKFFKLSDHSRVVVERIESRYAGGKSRYEQSDSAEFAPPLSGSPSAADSGANPLPSNGRRGGGSGPLTMPPPPAVSSIPPALADLPARPTSRPVSMPRGTATSFFPEAPTRKSGSPIRRGSDASEFLASAFQAGGAGPEVRDRARAEAQRARRDPESADLARELFGDLGGGEGAAGQRSNSGSAGTLAGGMAAPSGAPAPDSYAIATPVPAVELPRSASGRSAPGSLAAKIPSMEQLVEEAGKPEAKRESKRAPRGASQFPSGPTSAFPPGGSMQPARGSGAAAARRSSGAPDHQPLTLAISVPSSGGAAAATATGAESSGRSRVLLFAALATTITLGGVAIWVGMQRTHGTSVAPEHAAVPPAESAPPSAATAAPAAAEPTPPSAAAPAAAAAEPTPVAGPPVPVAVQAKPRGAEVTIAGTSHGPAPVVAQLPSNVPVEIVVKRAGYATVTRTITPAEGAPAETFELAPLPYHVVVTTEPAGATIAALGKSVVSPAPLELPHVEKPVTIAIALDGYQRTTRVVRLEEFREQDGAMRSEITLPLSPLPAARRRAPVAPVAPTAPAAPAAPAAPSEAPAVAPADAPPAPAEAPVVRVIPQAEAPEEPAPAEPAPAPEAKEAPPPEPPPPPAP